MKITPNIIGKKTKSIRVDPSELAEFRQNLKKDPQWAKYAGCTDSELVRMALIFGNIYVQPSVVTMEMSDHANLVYEAVSSNIAKVAAAFGGVGQLNPDGTTTLSHPDWDSLETFETTPVSPRPASIAH